MKRKNLNADDLYGRIKSVFYNVPEHRKKQSNIKIPLHDALMSGFAVFALKFPSLLQFDKARNDEKINANLRSLFSIGKIPSDTQMREILDPVNPKYLRPAFRKIFTELQRGNELQKFQYLDGHYLLAIDGTGQFGSTKVNCQDCIQKNHRSGKVGYYHQLLGASIVHPDIKQVIPLCPEAILNQDGAKKQDCERKSTKRWLEEFRKEHPKLKGIILEDSLAANVPHIKSLQENNLSFIINAKPTGNKYLFEQFKLNDKNSLTKEYGYYQITGDKVKKKVTHKYKFINELDLNLANPGFKVNFCDYEEITEYVDPSQDKKGIGTIKKHFSWITDLKVTKENVVQIVRAARTRWRIENENFKTLKEESLYNIEHSYGHGNKHLCTIFAYLTILSFLIDQTQEISCSLFNKALTKASAKFVLWGEIKSFFKILGFENWEQLFSLLSGNGPSIQFNTS